jgi:aminopeptidase N
MMKKFVIASLLILFSSGIFAQNLHSDSIDVLHYHIKIDNINYSESMIWGQTDLKIVPKQNNTTHFSLDLLTMTCDSIKLNEALLNFAHNDTILNISLNDAISPDDTINLSVFYHGNPQPDPYWGGFYFMNNYAFNLGVAFADIPHNYGRVWYPCIDDFIDRATYDFSITTETNQLAVCNGMLTEIDTIVQGTDSSLVHHWHMSDDIPTYLVSMSVGEYEIAEWIYEGIERDIPVKIYHYPGDYDDVMASFANLDTTCRIYETLFGPYVWQRIGYTIVPFNSGAMEHATNIAIGNGFIDGTLQWENLIAHELFHHWFGDYITCQRAEEMWINEGWAKYSETINEEFLYGEEAGKNYRRSHHKDVIVSAHTDDGDFYAVNAVPQDVTYGTTSYYKGASVVHSLRDYLGDDLFFPSVRAMLEQKAFQDISSEEMRDILSAESGIDLTDFFENWVFKPGLPHYKLDSVLITNNGTTYDANVFVKQQLYGRNTLSNGNIVNIGFVDENYQIHEERMQFDGEFGNQTFTLDFYPLFVAIDINENCSDAKLSKFETIKNTGTNYYTNQYAKINVNELEDSALFYVSHHWGAPDAMKNPIEGLVLANHRYWHIDGDFPNGLACEGVFYYSNTSSGGSSALDSEFISNSLDSLRIMHRANPQADWEIVENQSLSTFMKYIKIDELKAGEYTFGIFDWDAYHALEENIPFNVSVYPNPASEKVNIQADENFDGTFYILNTLGHEIVTGQLNKNRPQFTWTGKKSPGLYFVVFKNKNGKRFTQKLIIQ